MVCACVCVRWWCIIWSNVTRVPFLLRWHKYLLLLLFCWLFFHSFSVFHSFLSSSFSFYFCHTVQCAQFICGAKAMNRSLARSLARSFRLQKTEYREWNGIQNGFASFLSWHFFLSLSLNSKLSMHECVCLLACLRVNLYVCASRWPKHFACVPIAGQWTQSIRSLSIQFAIQIICCYTSSQFHTIYCWSSIYDYNKIVSRTERDGVTCTAWFTQSMQTHCTLHTPHTGK